MWSTPILCRIQSLCNLTHLDLRRCPPDDEEELELLDELRELPELELPLEELLPELLDELEQISSQEHVFVMPNLLLKYFYL